VVVADNNVGCSCRNGIAGTNNCDMSDLVSGVRKTGDQVESTWVFCREGEENFVGDSEIIALGGASNETKDRPLG